MIIKFFIVFELMTRNIDHIICKALIFIKFNSIIVVIVWCVKTDDNAAHSFYLSSLICHIVKIGFKNIFFINCKVNDFVFYFHSFLLILLAVDQHLF